MSTAALERPQGRSGRIASRPGIVPPSIILIGASTGGPQALTTLLGAIAAIVPRLPICVTLHMPAELVPVISGHIAASCGVATHVLRTEQDLRAGTVYFAPGDRHVSFKKLEAGRITLRLKRGRPGENCKPAVDVMFASAAACFGPRALAVVLSGMGKDGLAGARALAAAGGDILVQDEATSAVWGMPGAIAKAELASAILPPQALAGEIMRRTSAFESVR